MNNEILIALLICISCVFCMYFICTLRIHLSNERISACWDSIVSSYAGLKAKIQLFEDEQWMSTEDSLPDNGGLVKVILDTLEETLAVYDGDNTWTLIDKGTSHSVLLWHYVKGREDANTK